MPNIFLTVKASASTCTPLGVGRQLLQLGELLFQEHDMLCIVAGSKLILPLMAPILSGTLLGLLTHRIPGFFGAQSLQSLLSSSDLLVKPLSIAISDPVPISFFIALVSRRRFLPLCGGVFLELGLGRRFKMALAIRSTPQSWILTERGCVNMTSWAGMNLELLLVASVRVAIAVQPACR